MPVSLTFKQQIGALAAAFALGVGVGAGAALNGQNDEPAPAKSQHKKAAAKAPSLAAPAAPAPVAKTTLSSGTFNAGIPAYIIKVDADGVAQVRAHTWVSQYLMTSVCLKEVTTKCREQAEVSKEDAGKIAAGNIVRLYNIKSVNGGAAESTTVLLPNTSPGKASVPGPIPAEIVKITDGDTVQVQAQIWTGQYVVINVRILGIDTPEKAPRAKCTEEAELAKKASAETNRAFSGKSVYLYDVKFDKYGERVLAKIKTQDTGLDASQNLIDKGLARSYEGKTKESWCGIRNKP